MLFLDLPPLAGEYWVQKGAVRALGCLRAENPTAELRPPLIYPFLIKELRREKSFTSADVESDYLGAMYRVAEDVDGFETNSDPERRFALRLTVLWDFTCDYLRASAVSVQERRTVKFRALHWVLQDFGLEEPGKGKGLSSAEFTALLRTTESIRIELSARTGARFFPREDRPVAPPTGKTGGRLIKFPGPKSKGPGGSTGRTG